MRWTEVWFAVAEAFGQQPLLTLLDKGLLALVLAWTVHRLAKALEQYKAQLARAARLEDLRRPAARKLIAALTDLEFSCVSVASHIVGPTPRKLRESDRAWLKKATARVAMLMLKYEQTLQPNTGYAVMDVVRAAYEHGLACRSAGITIRHDKERRNDCNRAIGAQLSELQLRLHAAIESLKVESGLIVTDA